LAISGRHTMILTNVAAIHSARGELDKVEAIRTELRERADPWIAFWKLYAWRPIWKDAQCAALMRATSLFPGTSA
jgi:hypothetical protein